MARVDRETLAAELVGREYSRELCDSVCTDWAGFYPVVRAGRIIDIEDCAWPRWASYPIVNDEYIDADGEI